MKKLFYLLSLCILIAACTENKEDQKEIWKSEIIEMEAAFCKMANEVGIKEAFIEYAANDAVLERRDQLVLGKEAIANSFRTPNPNTKVELIWAPDFVDVSSSGDLAYTYGPFTYSVTDSTGKKTSNEGIFHTVWKRQADGKWKYVWD